MTGLPLIFGVTSDVFNPVSQFESSPCICRNRLELPKIIENTYLPLFFGSKVDLSVLSNQAARKVT
jgi:hypothetical protein